MPGLPAAVLKRGENRACADCGNRDPKWASVNLGIIICESCAGTHRNLGTHITKVKSTILDEWKPEWITTVQSIGNRVSNDYYEHNVPEGERYVNTMTVNQGDKMDFKEGAILNRWIRAKYDEKKFTPPGVDAPKERLARGENLAVQTTIRGAKSASQDIPPPEEGESRGWDQPQNRRRRQELSDKTGNPESRSTFAADRKDVNEPVSPEPGWLTVTDARGSEGKPQRRKDRRRRSNKTDNTEGATGNTGYKEGSSPFPTDYGMVPHGMQLESNAYMMGPGQRLAPAHAQAHGPEPPLQDGEDWWKRDVWSQAGNFWPSTLTSAESWAGSPPTPGASIDGLGFSEAGYHGPYTAQITGGAVSAPPNLAGLWKAEKVQLHSVEQGYAEQSSVVQPGSGEAQDGNWVNTVCPLVDGNPQTANGMSRNLGPNPSWVPSSRPLDSPGRSSMATCSAWGPYTPQAADASPEGNNYLQAMDTTPATQPHQRQPKATQWFISQEAFVLYARIFQEADSNQDNIVEGSEVRGLFDQSGLGPKELALIWAMCDSNAAGRLTLEEFVCAMHIVARRREGVDLPRVLPLELSNLVRHLATEYRFMSTAFNPQQSPALSAHGDFSADQTGVFQWTISPEDLDMYCNTYADVDTQGLGTIGPDEAKELLERTNLSTEELANIWRLSDRDLDGRLSLPESVCAMHLASRRLQGFPLPGHVPDEILLACRKLTATTQMPQQPKEQPMMEHLSTEQLPREQQQQQALQELANQRLEGMALHPELPPELASSVAADVPEVPLQNPSGSSPWTVNPQHLVKYRSIFSAHAQTNPMCLSSKEARELLEQSGLSCPELSEIWRLADLDNDGLLTFGEFACAMHLVGRRRQNLDIPQELPAELLTLAASSGGAGTLASDSSSPASSPWVISPLHLAQYQKLFQRLETKFVGADAASALFSNSQLPAKELSQIWSLADMDGDDRLSLQEFLCAMHLLVRRREGLALPVELPSELVGSIPTGKVFLDHQPNRGFHDPNSLGMVSWAISSDLMQRYRMIFKQHGRPGTDVLSADEARVALENSGLPHLELAHIWHLVDTKGNGCLTVGEFACAVHMVSLRRKGVALPQELPAELAVVAASSSEHTAEMSRPLTGWA